MKTLLISPFADLWARLSSETEAQRCPHGTGWPQRQLRARVRPPEVLAGDPRPGLLRLGAADTRAGSAFAAGCSVRWDMFSSISGPARPGPTRQMPLADHPGHDKHNHLQTLPSVRWGARSPPAENPKLGFAQTSLTASLPGRQTLSPPMYALNTAIFFKDYVY